MADIRSLIAAYLMSNPAMASYGRGPSLESQVPPPQAAPPPVTSASIAPLASAPTLEGAVPPPGAAPPPVTAASFGAPHTSMPRTFAQPPAVGGALNDQNRTAAFDPVKDAMDPGNIGAVNAQGQAMYGPLMTDQVRQALAKQLMAGGAASP